MCPEPHEDTSWYRFCITDGVRFILHLKSILSKIPHSELEERVSDCIIQLEFFLKNKINDI